MSHPTRKLLETLEFLESLLILNCPKNSWNSARLLGTLGTVLGLFVNFDFYRFWCREYEEKLSEFIANLLTSKYPINSPNKRKRPGKNANSMSNTPSSEQVSKLFDLKSE